MDADNDFMEKTFEKWTTTNTQNDFKTYCEICIENEKGVRIAHKMDSDGNMVSSMEKISNYDYKTLEKDVGVKLLYSSGTASYKVNGENAFSLYNSAYIPNEVMLNVEGTTEALKDYRCYNLNFWLNYYSEDFEKLYACITYTSNGMEYKVYRPIDVKLIRVWQKITLPIDLQDANGSFSNIKLSFVTFNESNTAIKQYISGYVSCFRMVPNAISKLNIMGQSFEDTISISTASGTVQLKSENHKFTRSDFMKTMESFNLKKLGREEAWQIYYDNGKKRVEGSHFFGMTYDKFSANFMGNTDPEWYIENISADGRVITKQYYEYNETGCLTTTKTTIDGGEEIITTTQSTYQKPDCQIEDSGHGVKIKREYFDDGNLEKEALIGKDGSELVTYKATCDDTGEYIKQEEHGYFVYQTYTYSNFALDKMERIGYNNNKYKETYGYDALQENLEELTAYENDTEKAWNVMSYENGKLATIWDRKADYKFDRYQDLDYVIFNIRENSRWYGLETQELDRVENQMIRTYWRTLEVNPTDTFIYAYDEYDKPISETYNDQTKVTYNYASGSESEAAWPLATVVDGYCGRTYTYTYNADGLAKSVSFDGFSVEKVNESEKKYTIGTDTITQKVVQDTKPKAITYTFNGTETPIFDRYYTYDNFGRVQKKQSLKKNEDETYTLLSEAEVGHGHLYMEPVSDTYKRGEETKYSAEYRHDQWGNVETVTHSGLFDGTVTYEYDALSRLKKETTAGSTVLPNGVKTYEYEDTYGRMSTFNGNALEFDKRGRLKTCGEIEFTYDNYGNCTKKQNYHTGAIFNYAWTRGRLLDSVNATTYTYNKDGIRTRKVVVDGYNIITHEYFYDGSKLIAEKVGDDYFYFFYDESGVCGFRYKDINYEYVKNIFGDIIGIYNEYGTHVATYAYDAWGNMIYCNAGTDVAYINPFLYRGYYYDSESGLYYLMTRYYDTQIGRFISPDTPDYLAPDTVGGVDLYAYGLNNPVMYVDPTGHFVLSAWMVGALVGFGVSFVSSLVSQALTGESLADGKVWAIATIDGVFGGISGAISTIPGLGPILDGVFDASITALNSLITTAIQKDGKIEVSDLISIGINSIFAGVIGGVGSARKIGISDTKAFANAENAFDEFYSKFARGGYRKKNQYRTQKAVNAATKEVNKLTLKAFTTFNAWRSYFFTFAQSFIGNVI